MDRMPNARGWRCWRCGATVPDEQPDDIPF